MIGYYILAFDGDSFENVLYPAMRRAYYMNDFGPLERVSAEYRQLTTYLDFAREWAARGCRRPLKLFTKGVCEYNVKSLGIGRIEPPDPAESDMAGWNQALEVLEREGRCSLIGVPCGQNRIIHSDLVNLCRSLPGQTSDELTHTKKGCHAGEGVSHVIDPLLGP